ncbi:MAG: endonuclease/exonuclease/phosphatase family protein [Jannaschia sp.]
MAETLRVATYHSDLSRKGPAVLLRDIAGQDDAQVRAVTEVIARAGADVILLLDFDWDLDGLAVAALQTVLAERGAPYPHHVALRPNSGQPSGFDLDRNGRWGEGRDALGYGRFTGDGAMVLLSRVPLGAVTDHSDRLWTAENPGAESVLPEGAGSVVPLASVAQWVVPLRVEGADITLVTMSANTPVFDGPEDRNGLRNADELAFVARLAETLAMPIVLGRANLDPADGDGTRGAIEALLAHPALQDPRPRGDGGGGAGHRGDPALDTMDWDGPGPLRVDYVLPSRALTVEGSGVLWPAPDDPFAAVVATASRGRLVWVDIALP